MAKQTKTKVLRVVARRDGFRRAGIAFGAQPTDLPLGALTQAQIDAIKSDPMLVATEVEIEVEAEA